MSSVHSVGISKVGILCLYFFLLSRSGPTNRPTEDEYDQVKESDPDDFSGPGSGRISLSFCTETIFEK